MIFIILAVLSSLIIKNKFSEKLFYFLKVVIVLYLLLSLPILDYFYLYPNFIFWPEGFYPSLSFGIPLDFNQPYEYERSSSVFNFLDSITDYLVSLSIILFVFFVNHHFDFKGKASRNWIPFYNVFVISKAFILKLKSNLLSFVIVLWGSITCSWLLIIVLQSINSVYVLFGFFKSSASENLSPLQEAQVAINQDIIPLFNMDILNLAYPFLIFISGLLTLVLLLKLSKNSV